MNPENDNILITLERTVNVQLMEVSIFSPLLKNWFAQNKHLNNKWISIPALIWKWILAESWAIPSWQSIPNVQYKKAAISVRVKCSFNPSAWSFHARRGEGKEKSLHSLCYCLANFTFLHLISLTSIGLLSRN